MIRNLNFFKKIKSAEAPKLFSVLIDQFLLSLTTLLISVVLARTYDKINYADLVLLFSISMFVLGFQSSLVSKPYALSLNDFIEDDKESYFRFNLDLKLLFTIAFILVFPILYILSFDSWDMYKVLYYLLYVVSYISYYFVRETLLSERKTLQNLKYGIFCSLSIIAVLLIIFLNQLRDTTFFLVSTSAIYLMATITYLLNNWKKIKITKKLYLHYWGINWSMGKWLTGSNFLFHLSTSVYPWLLLYLATKDDIAVYGVLMSVASLLNPLLMALSSYLLPIFVKINTDYKQVDRSLKKWLVVFTSMSILLAVVGYFFGQTIINLIFGEKYAGLGILVIFPYLVQAINIISQPFRIALNAIKRTDINFWILIPRSAISVILGIILISSYGILGVFYTMIVENIFYQLVYFIVYKRIISKPVAIK